MKLMPQKKKKKKRHLSAQSDLSPATSFHWKWPRSVQWENVASKLLEKGPIYINLQYNFYQIMDRPWPWPAPISWVLPCWQQAGCLNNNVPNQNQTQTNSLIEKNEKRIFNIAYQGFGCRVLQHDIGSSIILIMLNNFAIESAQNKSIL